jgi:type II restriction enzyme
MLTSGCTAEIIYVTAFPDRKTFRKFSAEIAWETEAWVAEEPDHLIHFNGSKFLGAYPSPQG